MVLVKKFQAQWKGPLDAEAWPQLTLDKVKLVCRHDIEGDREDEVAKALAVVMGKARISYHGLYRYLTWNKSRWHVKARVNRRFIHLKAARLKASQARDIARALATLPGATDLRVEGHAKTGPE